MVPCPSHHDIHSRNLRHRLHRGDIQAAMTIRDTQRAAWESIQGKLPESRWKVWEAIDRYGEFGVTTFTVADVLGWPINCVSGRITELTKLGMIKDSGRRGENPSGKKAVLWIVREDRTHE